VAISHRGERTEPPEPRTKAARRKAGDLHLQPQKGRAGASAPGKKAAAATAGGRARKEPSETNLSMRVSSATLDIISTAAASEGKTRTEFVLESARRRAIEVLLDQRLLALDDEQYAAFMDVLDNPPKPNAWLRRLMASPAPWEK
jgi:uncharacterized protein (DUF1778 family)